MKTYTMQADEIESGDFVHPPNWKNDSLDEVQKIRPLDNGREREIKTTRERFTLRNDEMVKVQRP